jgi:hypothetical protein
MQYSLSLHGNNAYAKAPQCHVMRTLLLLLVIRTSIICASPDVNHHSDQITEGKMGGTCGTHRNQQNGRGLVEKPKVKRPPRRSSRSWENDTAMNLAQQRDKCLDFVYTVTNLRVP